MIKEPTVLILGAGASKPYGYPTGKELVDFVINTHTTLVDFGASESDAKEFATDLRRSAVESIDTFLERRRHWRELGKLAIAVFLMRAEREDNLYPGTGDNWYAFLMNTVDAGITGFDELEQNQISVITFNYDRSFEQFLFLCLSSRYGKAPEEVAETLTRFMPIVHVHGQLGLLDWQNSGDSGLAKRKYDAAYDSPEKKELVRACAEGITIMAEGEDDSLEFQKARRLIENAKHLFFLGFGYHETNLRRLGLLPDADKVRVSTGKREGIRGTCYKFPDAKWKLLRDRYYASYFGHPDVMITSYLENESKCLYG